MVAAVDATLVRAVSFGYMDLTNTLPRRLIIVVIAARVLFVVRGMAQLPPEPEPIISFYNGDLLIVGDAWFPTDPSAKPMKTHVRILCKRRVGMCALATSDYGDAGLGVEFLTVVSWTSKRVTLRDERLEPSCSVNDYVVDRAGNSVSLISSPGRLAERVECRIGPYQKPKKTVYGLVLHRPQR